MKIVECGCCGSVSSYTIYETQILSSCELLDCHLVKHSKIMKHQEHLFV